jgi:hypothetical protein
MGFPRRKIVSMAIPLTTGVSVRDNTIFIEPRQDFWRRQLWDNLPDIIVE